MVEVRREKRGLCTCDGNHLPTRHDMPVEEEKRGLRTRVPSHHCPDLCLGANHTYLSPVGIGYRRAGDRPTVMPISTESEG